MVALEVSMIEDKREEDCRLKSITIVQQSAGAEGTSIWEARRVSDDALRSGQVLQIHLCGASTCSY